MVFPVVMYGCESWTIKHAVPWRTDAFELWCWRKLSRVPWSAWRSKQYILKDISPECSLEDSCWGWTSNTLAHDAKNWLLQKDSDARKDWRQEEKGTTEDEMIGWHHQIDQHEFEQALGTGDGQESLACCSPWGCKESDTIEGLNSTDYVEQYGDSLKNQKSSYHDSKKTVIQKNICTPMFI